MADGKIDNVFFQGQWNVQYYTQWRKLIFDDYWLFWIKLKHCTWLTYGLNSPKPMLHNILHREAIERCVWWWCLIKFKYKYIVGYYNSLVRIIVLDLTPLILCVLMVMHEWRNVKSKVVFENFDFKKFFLLSDFVPKICWENVAGEFLQPLKSCYLISFYYFSFLG